MDAPKPKPPTDKKAAPTQKHEEAQKKPFKLKSHLSYRPFSDEALLKQMRDVAVTTDQEGVTK